jgi:hypothetical protein
MHWVRLARQFGSLAALFALAIQLVVAFAHVHSEDFQGSSSITISQQARGGGATGSDPARPAFNRDLFRPLGVTR